MPELIGRTLHRRYRVVRKIGEGGMSEVYLADDLRIPGARCALKVLRNEFAHQADLARRFLDEGQIRLEHPGIVRVYERFQDGDRLCVALEFVDGHSLADLLDRQGALDPALALPMFERILEALDHAHRSGVIHRDIKPSNILIGSDHRPKLCDFGIARQMGQRGRTATGTTLGTPHYMSPEQIKAPLTIDHRSDIYSAGVMLYEMLTGKVPFGDLTTDSEFALWEELISKDPPDPRNFKPELGAPLTRVLLKALRKDPARRYQGGIEFRDAIESALNEPAGADDGDPFDGRPAEDPREPRAAGAGGRRYVVYRHPTLGAQAVPVGFSWAALLSLGLPWLVAKGLWRQALLWLVAAALLGIVRAAQVGLAGTSAASLLGVLVAAGGLSIWLLPAARGHGWLEDRLQRRGFETLDEVRALNADAAVARAVGGAGRGVGGGAAD